MRKKAQTIIVQPEENSNKNVNCYPLSWYSEDIPFQGIYSENTLEKVLLKNGTLQVVLKILVSFNEI